MHLREWIFTLQIVDKVILEICLSAHSIMIRKLQLHKLEKGENKSIPYPHCLFSFLPFTSILLFKKGPFFPMKQKNWSCMLSAWEKIMFTIIAQGFCKQWTMNTLLTWLTQYFQQHSYSIQWDQEGNQLTNCSSSATQSWNITFYFPKPTKVQDRYLLEFILIFKFFI